MELTIGGVTLKDIEKTEYGILIYKNKRKRSRTTKPKAYFEVLNPSSFPYKFLDAYCTLKKAGYPPEIWDAKLLRDWVQSYLQVSIITAIKYVRVLKEVRL